MLDQESGAFRIIGPCRFDATPYQAAMDFVRGRFWVEGDLVAAVRAFTARTRPVLERWMARLLVSVQQSGPLRWLHGGRRADAADVQFHYDLSNDFYRQFLDSRMVYSCAYFRTPEVSLDDAQAAKLDLICRKLDLHPGDRFLDIGCGWGALLRHASEHFGVAEITGCTISRQQADYLSKSGTGVRVEERLYEELDGCYHKIASIGMFEHVGKSRLGDYFRKVRSLMPDSGDGLFLNHGIVRRTGEETDGESLFLQRHVFPGTSMVLLTDVIEAAERSGFEILDVENLRPHYALTCRAWVANLQRNAAACRHLVDEETYRTWLLYLAGSALHFEDGSLDVHQIVMCPRGSATRPLTREYQWRATLA
jgi:cyclopropane-fatty-acyl-phospholipid synthase